MCCVAAIGVVGGLTLMVMAVGGGSDTAPAAMFIALWLSMVGVDTFGIVRCAVRHHRGNADGWYSSTWIMAAVLLPVVVLATHALGQRSLRFNSGWVAFTGVVLVTVDAGLSMLLRRMFDKRPNEATTS